MITLAALSRPFGSSLKRRDESDATEGNRVMTNRSVKDPTLSKTENHQHRLIVPSATIVGIGISGGKDSHDLARPAQQPIEFIGRVHPGRRQTFHDWMFAILCSNKERKANSMAPRVTGRRVRDQLPITRIPQRPSRFRAASPSSNAAHLVIHNPIGKGVGILSLLLP
jgi:hypothetical protein